MKTASNTSAESVQDHDGNDEPVDGDTLGQADQDDDAAEQLRPLSQRADGGAAHLGHGVTAGGGRQGRGRSCRGKAPTYGALADGGAGDAFLDSQQRQAGDHQERAESDGDQGKADESCEDHLHAGHALLPLVGVRISGGGSGRNGRPVAFRNRMKNSNSSRRVVWMPTMSPSRAMIRALPSASTMSIPVRLPVASAMPTTATPSPAWASAKAPTRTKETVLTASWNRDSTNSPAA